MKTSATEREVFDILQRPRIAGLLVSAHPARVRAICAAAETAPILERAATCRDPKDDKFLELAVNGRADLIVSGDADPLIPNTFRGIPILRPAAFGHANAI